MKISRIGETQNINKRVQRVKIDTTGFGISENKDSEMSVTNSKASEAVKNNFLSNVSFKGHTEYLTSEDVKFYSTAGLIVYKISNPKEPITFDSHNAYDFRFPETAISTSVSYYPNSSIEGVIDKHYDVKFNKYKTDRVYFADPEEYITDSLIRDHDYIVYDNRPHYPSLDQLKANYYRNDGYNSENFGSHFNTLREYYERLELADLKEYYKLRKIQTSEYIDNSEKINYYQNRLRDSRHQQDLALQAYYIFEESAPLFMQRDELCRKINYYNDELEYTPKAIQEQKEKLAQKEAELEKVNNYLDKQTEFIKFQEENLASTPLISKNYSENESEFMDRAKRNLHKQLKPIYQQILSYERTKSRLEEDINEIRGRILPEMINHLEGIKNDLPNALNQRDELLRILAENFKKMENFYYNNIQEWQI